MSIMHQSSKAQDRTLGVWFQIIQQGMIKLPRFQRFEAWDRGRITSFLNTVINNLPVGVTLALEVAGAEKFVSRFIATAEPTTLAPVTQNLLDGQQRLTAFWRSMHNNYEWETFFIYFPQFDQEDTKTGTEIEVRCIPRWANKNRMRMPRYADDPAQCLNRGLIPVSLLRPGDIGLEMDRWLNASTKTLEPTSDDPDALRKYKIYIERKTKIKDEITALRERVTHFNLPFLSLPPDTAKDVALQVFINMNTNSKPLSLYDIIVAEVEGVAERSLHDMAASLAVRCSTAVRYGEISDLILTTSALLQDKLPNTRGMIETDKKQLLDNWPKVERGLGRMASFLQAERIFDEQRLPTNAVLPVIAAAYEFIPDAGDFLGKAEKLLRRYLWSSFFSDRYENAAASRAFADFKAIKDLLKNPSFGDDQLQSVPVLNRREHPLATVDSLLVAGWPKAAGIEARAILAATLYFGGVDFADHRPATYESVQTREYHHIFPDALLSEANISSYLALNCALITWKTNRIIGRKDPLEYLKERAQWADVTVVGERLKSHLISYKLLKEAHFAGLHGESLKARLTVQFDQFLLERARLVIGAMNELIEGNEPSLEKVWTTSSISALDRSERGR